MGPGSALARETAAEAWETHRHPVRTIHVVTPHRRRSRLAGVTVHQSRSLTDEDLVIRADGLAVTSVARTLVDLADSTPVHRLIRYVKEAAYREILDLRAVRRVAARNRNRPGHHALEDAIERYLTGRSTGSRSNLEDMAIGDLLEAGLPEPHVNTEVHACGRWIEVDLLWRTLRVCVEIDGPGHRRPSARRADERRDALLVAAGYRVLRVDASAVRRGTTARLVRTFLATA